MEKVFLALGSNISDKESYIKKAVDKLSEFVKDIQIAPVYVSKAVGFEDQPDFYNTVIKGFTQLDPFELFKMTKNIEKELGRVERFRWGPREIDIDILFYGNLILDTEYLVIPHPRLHERDFVLQPLFDIEPEFIHPVLKKTVKELLFNLRDRTIISCLKSYPQG
ncbi:2-amino-4-hydroxy-6-hydroxymethyldihydropteridinediphosphokinase [Persephonella hydrogeniphila]|uniref:2-amino-4-hydroxy-6-hydroxymethyldihydropteridine pyrophosphokinase n=1 Tax=Persephonella hydrogeniphila TaxID=198703 RepID=A0A285NF02_9AQUI|nr:2-amino-4-hydroxy-6-hydroxymethyldihydropteridine diphosphokinase [Persephonella hydrogeniphila]SNZ06486.1 2-amino-4-hydroxy-6-hydroxymethyldihydropteridinediphosphokinase [Persephonella hydrogeniphila]